ncbi:MAG: T9SS type A sorting domain-containing protein [Bacteroidales bacterium]|jgi:hypothetical protein|nr:T9SS type A sorting domain-containing protein [Bacteroidales bacterium]
MKTLSRKTLLMVVFSFIPIVFCHAQNYGEVTFGYDANGNRISRTIILGKIIEDGKNVEAEKELETIVTDQIGGVEFSIYPNPTRGRFLVEVSDPWKGPLLRVILLTPQGDVLTEKVLGVYTEEFDLSDYPAGIYMLHLMAGDEIHVWKIVKY